MNTFKRLLLGLALLLSAHALKAANPDNVWNLTPYGGAIYFQGNCCTTWSAGAAPWLTMYVRVYDTTGMTGSIDLNQLTPVGTIGWGVVATNTGPESVTDGNSGFTVDYENDMGEWSDFSFYIDGLDSERQYTLQIDYDSLYGAPGGGFFDVGGDYATAYRTTENFQLSVSVGW